jgi:hypothetical protein
MTSRRRQHGDPLEPLSEVWIGLRSEFAEGRVLMEEEIGLMQIIIARRILNYLKIVKAVGVLDNPTCLFSIIPMW